MSFLSFFSVTSPGHQGYLGATIVSTGLTDWQALGIELCLTFVITLVYLVITIFLSETKKLLEITISWSSLLMSISLKNNNNISTFNVKFR
jgi:hypothetical protein